MRWEDGCTKYSVECCEYGMLRVHNTSSRTLEHQLPPLTALSAPPQPGAAQSAVTSSARAPQPGGAQQGSSEILGISPLVSHTPLVGACWLRCSSTANQLVHTSSSFRSQNSAPLVAASRLAGGPRIGARGQGIQLLRGRAGLKRTAPPALLAAPRCRPPVTRSSNLG